MEKLNSILSELVENKIEIEALSNEIENNTINRLFGFYKSSYVDLYEKDNKLFVKARYDEITEVNSVEDIVRINKDWWDFSHDRCSVWSEPDPYWLPLLLKYSFIKEKTIKVYE